MSCQLFSVSTQFSQIYDVVSEMNAQFILDHILRGEVKIQELEKELEEERNNHTIQLERIQKLEAEKAENENTIDRLTREKEELVEALRKAKDGSKGIL